MKFLKRLFSHYEAYHQHGPVMLRYAGLLGVFGFPIFYLLRFTKPSPPFDDLWIRAVATLCCVLLVLKDRWPEKLKPYYIAFSYPALILSLPTSFVFTSLKNGGGAAAVGNTLVVAFLVILITDWRNTIVMLVVGIGSGVLLYLALDAQPRIPVDYVARLPLLVLVVMAGSFFKFAGNQAAAEKMRHGYASIAGSIAHEMRNPLSQIRYSLERMQRALPPPTATAQAQTLAGVEVHALYQHLAQSELAVKRGLQVIAMTLDEVSAKPMDTGGFRYLSAAQATQKAVQEYAFQSDAERAKVSVKVTEDFAFRGDETAYLFVVFNLIKNALYYLTLFPDASVTATVGQNQVRVRDTGPGIPAEALLGLFQPFSSSGKTDGTGLGLAYCRRVMRAFGGDIECESVLGEYTQFTLRFPPVDEQDSQAHRAAALERARVAFTGKRLLIVEDDAAQRMTTRYKLHPLGATVDEAADGQRALELLARRRYDLLLLDLNMPVLDGYALAERIRRGQVPANRDVRMIAYTSEPAHLASVKTQKAGMDGFVNKPCDQLQLVQALLQVLGQPAVGPGPQTLLAGRRIVLADDNPHNRKAVAAYLKHAGAIVMEADHGRAVLAQLHAPGPWDAILMDINMPGMNGLETTRAIRESGRPWSGVPIVALTAHSDEDMVQAAVAAGMDDFVTKPVDAEVLFATLSRLVNGAPAPEHALHLPPVPAQAPREAAADRHDSLLNVERLESYRRIGVLQELLDDYIPEIARVVQMLELSVAEQDFQASLEALHSLLGMSGEAGAQGLYRLVRSLYAPMVELRAWPADPTWLAQVQAAATQAEHALRACGPMEPAIPAAT